MSSQTVAVAARNYGSTPPSLLEMDFPQRLAQLRKDRGLTQDTLAERVGVHVSQIRRYERGTSTPTLDALRKLAIALSVSADTLVFDEGERGPDDDLRLQFEATARLSDDEKQTVRRVLEGLLIAHDVKHDITRWAA